MKLFKPSYNTPLVAINRSYFEADHGRVDLAFERLRELTDEFPDDPHTLYAIGQLRRDYLGQGILSREIFEKAYYAASNSDSRDTRWLALCNWTGLADNKEELRRLIDNMSKERQKDKSDFQHFITKLGLLNAGASYESMLLDEGIGEIREQNYGLAAALLEVAAGYPSSMTELSIRQQRALSLRALDAAAERVRSANAEVFPSEDRLALKEAVTEMTKCVVLDKYESRFWNYKSAWCVLLSQYEEAIKCADAAIMLRPYNYPRPHINKAQALWALGKEKEALMCAREAVEQAEVSDDSPADMQQAADLVVACSQPRYIPTLDDLEDLIRRLISSASRTCEAEFGQTPLKVAKTSLNKVVQHLVRQISLLQNSPLNKYVPITIDLLSDFTPETAFCASLKIAQQNKSWVEYLLMSALYISANSQGVLRRDAARYICLMTLVLVDRSTIRACYRQTVLEPSAVASDEMRNLDPIMRSELARINPLFPHLIADQAPVNEEGRQRAVRNILSHFLED
jgi:tetratricopeptide (TPR) repeat protein